ncbi:MAG: hypothetical protein GXX99_02560 [Clostridiales bacterium]|nr:hypothetical protein [Clostridiales bacterium]
MRNRSAWLLLTAALLLGLLAGCSGEDYPVICEEPVEGLEDRSLALVLSSGEEQREEGEVTGYVGTYELQLRDADGKPQLRLALGVLFKKAKLTLGEPVERLFAGNPRAVCMGFPVGSKGEGVYKVIWITEEGDFYCPEFYGAIDEGFLRMRFTGHIVEPPYDEALDRYVVEAANEEGVFEQAVYVAGEDGYHLERPQEEGEAEAA